MLVILLPDIGTFGSIVYDSPPTRELSVNDNNASMLDHESKYMRQRRSATNSSAEPQIQQNIALAVTLSVTIIGRSTIILRLEKAADQLIGESI